LSGGDEDEGTNGSFKVGKSVFVRDGPGKRKDKACVVYFDDFIGTNGIP